MFLYCQSFSTFSPSSFKDFSAPFCPHSNSKTMGTGSFDITLSINPLHIAPLLIKDLINFYKIMPLCFCQDKTLKGKASLTYITKKIKGEDEYDFELDSWAFF